MMDDYLPTTIHINTDPVAAKQITEFLVKHLGTCQSPGCKNVVVKDRKYRCWHCSDMQADNYFCLAEHQARVNLVERYSEDFLEDMWYPYEAYLCATCLTMLDAEYGLLCENPDVLVRLKWEQQFEKIMGGAQFLS